MGAAFSSTGEERIKSFNFLFRESGLSSRFCDGPFMGIIAMNNAKRKTAYALELRESSCRSSVGREYYDHASDTTYLIESVEMDTKFNSKLSSCTRSREETCSSKQAIFCIAYFDANCELEGVAISRDIIRARPLP